MRVENQSKNLNKAKNTVWKFKLTYSAIGIAS